MALAANEEIGTDLAVASKPGVHLEFDDDPDVDPKPELDPELDDKLDADLDASVVDGGWHSEAWG